MAIKNSTLYDQVVAVSEEFLGPAGERFIRRQIKTHLNIEPEKLNWKKMDDLIHWASLTFAVLSSSSEEVDDFRNKLQRLDKVKG